MDSDALYLSIIFIVAVAFVSWKTGHYSGKEDMLQRSNAIKYYKETLTQCRQELKKHEAQ